MSGVDVDLYYFVCKIGCKPRDLHDDVGESVDIHGRASAITFEQTMTFETF